MLIGRINGRLGNTLFLTPMIERIHALLPQARIDLALSYPHAPVLLAGLPGVRQIILFPHKGRGLISGYWRALRQLRAMHYDLAIDPTPFSTSGRLILSLTQGPLPSGLQCALAVGRRSRTPLRCRRGTMHQGRQPAYLVTTALGASWDPAATRLWLPLRPEEIAAARAAIDAALRAVNASVTPERPLVGYFGHATGLKHLPPAWWARFWRAFLALQPQAIALEFLPAAATPPTVARLCQRAPGLTAAADRRHLDAAAVRLGRRGSHAPRQHHRHAHRGPVSGHRLRLVRSAEEHRSQHRGGAPHARGSGRASEREIQTIGRSRCYLVRAVPNWCE